MKSKLPIPRPRQQQQINQVERQQSDEQISEQTQVQHKQQQIAFLPKQLKRQSLFVSFNGVIQYGTFQQCKDLAMFYSITGGPDWNLIAGQKNGISQIASSNGDKIVWNIPFQLSFQTTYISGWPQLIIMLYGTDFFGRSILQGYGNIHLPTGSGLQKRKIRIFKPLPQSVISGIFGYLSGVIAEYKDPQKVLSLGQGREVTRVKTMGQILISVQTAKYNFQKFGYQ